ncbi:hypothetical protein [Spirillospora sp. NPDC047279]|uniref:hypothetical protein n=1 Tax=Spirillospora sp. NPDC047279 TaxID=3155478 RepID=UPI0033C6B860
MTDVPGSPSGSERPAGGGTPVSAPYQVDMRWQGARGWAIATGFSVYFALGLTVITIVLLVTGEVGGAIGTAALAVIFGLMSWGLVRMMPRYSTDQGITVDDAGITLVQEPKWWFPGRSVHLPWSQVRGIGQERIVVRGEARMIHYVTDIELAERPGDGALPSWSMFEGDGNVRILVRKRSKHARIGEVLLPARADS